MHIADSEKRVAIPHSDKNPDPTNNKKHSKTQQKKQNNNHPSTHPTTMSSTTEQQPTVDQQQNNNGADAADKKKKKKTLQTQQHFVNETPVGEKKDTTKEMANAYYPASVESAWYDWWEQSGFFKGDNEDDTREKFVIVIPPPNVTGALHLGHALTVSIQDCLCRWYVCLFVCLLMLRVFVELNFFLHRLGLNNN